MNVRTRFFPMLVGVAGVLCASEVPAASADVLEKRNGKWLIVHEHISFPVDPESGKADFLSKP